MDLIATPDGVLPGELLDTFLAAPLPRYVPPSLMKKVLEANSLFAVHPYGKYVAIGFMLAFGLCAALFFPWNYPVDFLMRRGMSEEGAGRIVSYERTGRVVNDNPVMRVNMLVTGADGNEHKARCYVEGESGVPGYAEGRFEKSGRATKPVPVRVLYYTRDPRYAIFRGARLDSDSGGQYFLIPALFFAALLLHGSVKRRRIYRLLRDGQTAFAEVTYIKELKASLNECRLCSMRFTFPHSGGSQTIRRILVGPRVEAIRSAAHVKGKMRVLHDRGKPGRALLLDMVGMVRTPDGDPLAA